MGNEICEKRKVLKQKNRRTSGHEKCNSGGGPNKSQLLRVLQ
jgi:hypothetical protein